MTKTGDKITQDAVKASDLIKETAERTATALNIQYIQKDIAEIKDNIKAINKLSETFMSRNEYESRHKQLEAKVDIQTKFVYMGLGAVALFQLMLTFFNK